MTEAAHSFSRLPLRDSLRRALAASPAGAYAIRFGVAVSAAIWIGKTSGMVDNHATWILITVLMVMQPTTGGSLLKGVLRLAGTLAAALTSILLFKLFAQDPPLLMAGLFLVQALGAYGNSGRRFQYAWFVWAFTSAIVLGEAMAGRGAVETVAFQRASMVGIGVVLVSVLDSLLWPARAESRLQESLASRARALGEALRRVISASADPRGSASASPAPEAGTLASQLALVDAVRSELGVSSASADALSRLVLLLETLASRARVLAKPIEQTHELDAEDRALAATLSVLGRRVELALGEVAAAVTASRAPTPFSDDLEQALLAVEDELRRNRGSASLQGRAADLRDLVSVLCTLEETLSSGGEAQTAARPRSLLQLRPDPFRVKIALRSGISVIAAFVIPLALGWPMNTLVAPFAFLFAAFTRGAGVQTLAMVSVSIAFGWLVADLSIIYLAPHVGRAPLALVIPFAVAVASAYLAARRPQLALLPSIGGLIALLSVFGGTSTPTDVYGPYNTVCYLALAAGIGLLLGRVMWPATAASLVRQRVAVQLELCLSAVRGAQESLGAERGRRITDLMRGCAEQSVQLGRLHNQALHEPVERGLDPSLRAEILSLAMDLVDAVAGYHPLEHADSLPRPLLEGLQRSDLALLDSMQAAVDVMRGEAEHLHSALRDSDRDVRDRLLEQRRSAGTISDLTDEEERQLLLQLDSQRRLILRQLAIEDWFVRWQQAKESRM